MIGRGAWFVSEEEGSFNPSSNSARRAVEELDGKDENGYLSEARLHKWEALVSSKFMSLFALDLHSMAIATAWNSYLLIAVCKESESIVTTSWFTRFAFIWQRITAGEGVLELDDTWDTGWSKRCQYNMPSIRRLCRHVLVSFDIYSLWSYLSCTLLKYISFLCISLGFWSDHSVSCYRLKEEFAKYSLEVARKEEIVGVDARASFAAILEGTIGSRALIFLIVPSLSGFESFLVFSISRSVGI